MPDLNDYHAFISTSGKKSGGYGGFGCSGRVCAWILIILGILLAIGKTAG